MLINVSEQFNSGLLNFLKVLKVADHSDQNELDITVSSQAMEYFTFSFCLTGLFFWKLLQTRSGLLQAHQSPSQQCQNTDNRISIFFCSHGLNVSWHAGG